jgi:hypothetical protein
VRASRSRARTCDATTTLIVVLVQTKIRTRHGWRYHVPVVARASASSVANWHGRCQAGAARCGPGHHWPDGSRARPSLCLKARGYSHACRALVLAWEQEHWGHCRPVAVVERHVQTGKGRLPCSLTTSLTHQSLPVPDKLRPLTVRRPCRIHARSYFFPFGRSTAHAGPGAIGVPCRAAVRAANSGAGVVLVAGRTRRARSAVDRPANSGSSLSDRLRRLAPAVLDGPDNLYRVLKAVSKRWFSIAPTTYYRDCLEVRVQISPQHRLAVLAGNLGHVRFHPLNFRHIT